MPDFRVTHQALREANGSAVCGKLALRVVAANLVHVSRVGVLDGITLDAFLRRDTPAIVNAVRSINMRLES